MINSLRKYTEDLEFKVGTLERMAIEMDYGEKVIEAIRGRKSEAEMILFYLKRIVASSGESISKDTIGEVILNSIKRKKLIEASIIEGNPEIANEARITEIKESIDFLNNLIKDKE